MKIYSMEEMLQERQANRERQANWNEIQQQVREQEAATVSKMERLIASLSFEERLVIQRLLKGGGNNAQHADTDVCMDSERI